MRVNMNPQKKIVTSYAISNVHIPSAKLKRMVCTDSTLKRDFILLLEFDNRVIEYVEQPVVIPVPLGRNYIPDFYVKYEEGGETHEVIYEIKYRCELKKNLHKLKPKFRAAIKYCKSNSYKFKVLTEKEIRTEYLKNIEFLLFFMRTTANAEDEFRRILSINLAELGVCSPEELLALSFNTKLKRAEATPVLWRMIGEGSIETDLDKKLSMNSQLRLCEEIKEWLW